MKRVSRLNTSISSCYSYRAVTVYLNGRQTSYHVLTECRRAEHKRLDDASPSWQQETIMVFHTASTISYSFTRGNKSINKPHPNSPPQSHLSVAPRTYNPSIEPYKTAIDRARSLDSPAGDPNAKRHNRLFRELPLRDLLPSSSANPIGRSANNTC